MVLIGCSEPWTLPVEGFLISCLGLVLGHWRISGRPAKARTAHALWGAINGEYRKLDERCRDGDEVTEWDLASVVAQDNALSMVTKAEDQRDEFLGVKPAGECWTGHSSGSWRRWTFWSFELGVLSRAAS